MAEFESNRNDLAEVIGISPRQIHTLLENGMPSHLDRRKRRRFNLKAAVPWYIRELKRRLRSTEKDEVELREKRARMELAEIELAEKQGGLVTLEIYHKVLGSVLDDVRANVLNLPGKVAPQFPNPREAMELGIATVYQDLAMIPLMSITRNFFLAREPTRGVFRMFDWKRAETIVREEMKQIGLDVRDPSQPTGTLSGGERQSLAIARAVYFGAKLLILDEPTSALGVAQSASVLKQIRTLRDRGGGIILITHNVRDAYAAGDRFTVLDRGRSTGTQIRDEVTIEALQDKMAGGKL